MEENQFPPYQFSVFVGKAQFVIRATNYEDFKTMLSEVNALAKAYENTHTPTPEASTTPQNDVMAAYVANPPEKKFCAIHGGELKVAISKKTNKPYWYHRVGEEMCFGSKPKNY